jgi:hypothetical protein
VSPDAELVLLYRDGCHLCEDMAAALHRGWPDAFARLDWRLVDDDPAWVAAYGDRIPVLLAGGEAVCETRPDPARLAEYFGPPSNPL